VVTGLTLDKWGVINVLDSQEWSKDRDELQRQGGPP
jgi:hypothetical protein